MMTSTLPGLMLHLEFPKDLSRAHSFLSFSSVISLMVSILVIPLPFMLQKLQNFEGN